MAEKITREGPPTFDGLGDPFAAERWIRALERIFEYVGCEDRDKLNSATYQLVDEADFWWESVKRTITLEEWEEFTWDDFRAEFFGKYIPDYFKQRKQNEFWNLRQGKGTVTEYDRTFNQLSRYAPHLVDTDEKRATRFRRGLKTEIAVSLASQGTMSYAQTLSRALDIEALLPRDRENRPVVPDGRGKRKWEDRSGGSSGSGYWRGPQPPQQQQQQQQQYQQRALAPQDPRPVCPQCQKLHSGPCRQGSTDCFRCGKPGHFARSCPNPGNGGADRAPQQQRNNAGNHGWVPGQARNQGPAGRQPMQARAYALSKQQVAKALGNLAGMIYINDLPVLALFDTGASHSFISKCACERLHLVTTVPENGLEVSIPAGKTVSTEMVCLGQRLKIGELAFRADLHVIEMRGIDLILGMDWLEKNGATIRCPEREVLFQTSAGETVAF